MGKPKGIVEHFKKIPDPRIDRQKRHELIDVIVITIFAVICGCESWEEIELFGKIRKKWLKRFLELPHGIPSHDTFRRVFCLIWPDEFQKCFVSWVQEVCEEFKGEIINVDGKTLRRSHNRRWNKSAVHMVSAWASQNRMVLGQVATLEKSNEITAIPELLRMLEIKGCIVTIDAMGCQKEIAKEIKVEKKADYVLAVKGNQETLYKEITEFFQKREEHKNISFYETIERNRGRKEIRRYYSSDDINGLTMKDDWEGLKTVIMVDSERHEDDKVAREQRYYISSLKNKAKVFANAIRGHWGVENSLHWVLDVTFREDESRKRTGYSAENFSTVRRIALNLLRKDKSKKLGVRGKRIMAACDPEYLLSLFNISNF